MRHLHGDARARRAKPVGGTRDPGVVDLGSAVQREDLRAGEALRRLAEHRDVVLTVRHDAAVQ